MTRSSWSGPARRAAASLLAGMAATAGAGAALGQPVPGASTAQAPPAGPATEPSLASVVAAMPKNLPRKPAPGLAAAIEAAEAAEQACAARGAKVSVLVADSAGAPVVLLSGDGAGVRSQLIARTKVNIVVKFALASGEVKNRAKLHPELAAEAAADPEIGLLREGGFPVLHDGRMIGAVAVSGASLSGPHSLDEDCARVAVAYLQQH